MQDPTAAPDGVPIRTDEVQEYRDIFDYTLKRWQAENPAMQTGPLARLAEEFCTFARETAFKGNKPVGMDYLGRSLALRFQDGLVLPFVDGEDGLQGVGGVQGGVGFAKPDSPAQRGGKGATVPTASFGVTGNDDRQ